MAPVVVVGFDIRNFVEHPEEVFAVPPVGHGFQTIDSEQLFRECRSNHLIDGNVLRFSQNLRLPVKLVRNVDVNIHVAVHSSARNSDGERTAIPNLLARGKSFLL
jgi:hypothetical protein